jgi:hypothetical protein
MIAVLAALRNEFLTNDEFLRPCQYRMPVKARISSNHRSILISLSQRSIYRQFPEAAYSWIAFCHAHRLAGKNEAGCLDIEMDSSDHHSSLVSHQLVEDFLDLDHDIIRLNFFINSSAKKVSRDPFPSMTTNRRSIHSSEAGLW